LSLFSGECAAKFSGPGQWRLVTKVWERSAGPLRRLRAVPRPSAAPLRDRQRPRPFLWCRGERGDHLWKPAAGPAAPPGKAPAVETPGTDSAAGAEDLNSGLWRLARARVLFSGRPAACGGLAGRCRIRGRRRRFARGRAGRVRGGCGSHTATAISPAATIPSPASTMMPESPPATMRGRPAIRRPGDRRSRTAGAACPPRGDSSSRSMAAP
jgi:hypothetical protein